MLENLQSMNLRSATASPASVMGTPPRHPGSATAELPRRVTSDETRSKRHHICFKKKNRLCCRLIRPRHCSLASRTKCRIRHDRPTCSRPR